MWTCPSPKKMQCKLRELLGFDATPFSIKSIVSWGCITGLTSSFESAIQPSCSKHASPWQPFTNMPTLLPWHSLWWIDPVESSCTLENQHLEPENMVFEHDSIWRCSCWNSIFFSFMFPFMWPSESSNPYPVPAGSCQAALQMANEMPLYICRHQWAFFDQLLHIVFPKMSSARNHQAAGDRWKRVLGCVGIYTLVTLR